MARIVALVQFYKHKLQGCCLVKVLGSMAHLRICKFLEPPADPVVEGLKITLISTSPYAMSGEVQANRLPN